jgi:hypothetical protein
VCHRHTYGIFKENEPNLISAYLFQLSDSQDCAFADCNAGLGDAGWFQDNDYVPGDRISGYRIRAGQCQKY